MAIKIIKAFAVPGYLPGPLQVDRRANPRGYQGLSSVRSG